MRGLVPAILMATVFAGPALADGAATYAAHCGGCHAVTGASGPTGPSLRGVTGRKIASLADYSYSAALKAKGGKWTPAALDAFIAGPSAFAPGSKMFTGLPAAADRAAVIAYLAKLK